MEEQVNTLNEQIEKNKEEIQSKYTDLGIAYYRIHGNDETAEFQNICQEIASKYRAIEQMKQEILNLTLTEENAKICPECGSKRNRTAGTNTGKEANPKELDYCDCLRDRCCCRNYRIPIQ